ncbi:hypothetical protein G9P44_004987 [Scheffersomyces stipitis]|nr:hypothetical protein G9P44_004987 [Scheffersomyces stipitis]
MPRLGVEYGDRSLASSAPNLRARLHLFANDKVATFNAVLHHSKIWFNQQSTLIRVLLSALVVVGIIAGIVVLIFHQYFIHLLYQLADTWHTFKYGQLLLFTLVFLVGFPPLIGFTALSTLTGMVYGFPRGWPLLASASISGSVVSFVVNRYWLHGYAVRLVNHNETFRAFAEILKEENSLFLLVLLRLCPLPYSLSNGALAAIPELSLVTYTLASLVTSPKLFIHLFVGHKLKNLSDDKSSTASKVVDVISIAITGLALAAASFIIYNRMQEKLQSYRNNSNNTFSNENYDRMIFGNFEDDLELASNDVELNSADFDADNFIIEDDDELLDDHQLSDPIQNNLTTSSIDKDSDAKSKTLPLADEGASDWEAEFDIDLTNSSNNRVY